MVSIEKNVKNSGVVPIVLALAMLLMPIVAAVSAGSISTNPQDLGTQIYGNSGIIPKTQEDKIVVVTSTALLGDFVKNLGGDYVELKSVIVEGNQDPHTYEPTPSDLDTLINADLFFLMGRPDLEPWWEGEGGYKETVLQDNPNLKVIKVMNDSMVKIDPLSNEPNPHGWMSPVIAKEMVRNIYVELINIASDDVKSSITQSYHDYLATLDELIDEINGNRTVLEGTKVVMHHPAMMYLYDMLGVQRVGIIEEKHGVEPSAQKIQQIKETMESTGTKIIVHQSNLDDDQIIQLARETNSSIVLSAPLIGMLDYNKESIDTYVELIRANIGALLHPLTVEEYEKWSGDSGSSIDAYPLLIVGTLIGIVSLITTIIRKERR